MTAIRLRLISIALSVLAAGGAMVQAATYFVDQDGSGDYTTIQSAINDVSNGDLIIVRAGRYHETINFLGKSITLQSESGPAATTIFLEEQTRIVNLNGDSTFQGFTVTGGRSRIGGGIYVTDGAAPVIDGNIIEGNTAAWNGVLPGFGGGIEVDPLCSPVITRNVIRDNLATGDAQGFYAYGAGLDLADDSTAVVRNNIFDRNSTTDSGGGLSVGIAGTSSPVEIVHNTVFGNLAGQGGQTSNIFGGGVTLDDGAVVVFRNNLIVDNDVTANGQGGGTYFFSGGLQTTTYENNDYDANIPDDCAGLPGSKCSNGQFFVTPLFLDPAARNYRPRSDSPILDLGTSAGAPAQDFSSFPRNVDSDLDGTAAPDIGAFENQGEITRLLFTDPSTLSWDPSINGAVRFELYRDDLTALGAGAAGNCLNSGIAGTNDTDPTIPSSGGGFFYLVNGKDVVRGSLGFGSDGTGRIAATVCP